MGRLYVPARKSYRRGRGLIGELASRGELSRVFARGRELGRLNGRGRELYGLAGRLGGFPGENKAQEGPREERESSTGASEAWESPRVEGESFAGENKAGEGP